MFSDFLDSTIYNIREGSNRNQIELSIDGGASKSFPIYGNARALDVPKGRKMDKGTFLPSSSKPKTKRAQ